MKSPEKTVTFISHFVALVGLLFTLVLAACDKGTHELPQEGVSPDSPSPSPESPSPESSSLDIFGVVWKAEVCGKYLSETYSKYTIEFLPEGRFSHGTTVYSDNSCSQVKEDFKIKGTVVFGREITTPSGRTAHEVDLHFTPTDKTQKSLFAREGDILYRATDFSDQYPSDIDRAAKYFIDSVTDPNPSP
jgi:hypothetical protein